MAGRKRLGAGRLRQRIEIWRSVETKNGRGGFTDDWQMIAATRAEILGQPGREAVLEQALQGIAVYKITIRFRDDVLASDQLRWSGRILNITAPPVDPDGLRKELVITASTESVQKLP
ncbi:phage head closure protein [Sphingomonas sp. 3-13AW]|uniref:phage head closure protein n=1 Tax=Sphingomonas sp. 3-13AW TaxID=3050450 RepID=UPI003BB604D5